MSAMDYIHAKEIKNPPPSSGTIFRLKHIANPVVNNRLNKEKPSSAASKQKSLPPTRPNTSALASRFGAYSKSSFFTRHNPHPSRVRHIRGLNGIPICVVNDEGSFPSPRYSLDPLQLSHQKFLMKNRLQRRSLGLNSSLFPVDTITGLQSYPYREKAIPKFGLIPVTESWREELKEFCYKAGLIEQEEQLLKQQKKQKSAASKRQTVYSAKTGRLVPAKSRLSSRASSRSLPAYNLLANLNHISVFPDSETVMLQMLCQILQTDSVHDVQQWLVSAGDREKSFVLDLIKEGIGALDTKEQAADDVLSRVSTAASHRSKLESRAGSILNGGLVLPDINGDRSSTRASSRASSVRSVRPLGSLPASVKPELVVIEEDDFEEVPDEE